MTLKKRFAAIILGTFIIALVAAACGGTSVTDIVQTRTAQNQIDNATATAEVATTATVEARVAAGTPLADIGEIDVGNVQAQVGAGSVAATAQAGGRATATALAEAGVVVAGVGSDVDTGQDEIPGDVEIPEGPAQSGSVTVTIGNAGEFDPEVVKITPGTTVVWETERRSASSTSALPGQAEDWDSGAISKGTFDREPKRFEHIFTELGCHSYKSNFSGDVGTGAVCVVDE